MRALAGVLSLLLLSGSGYGWLAYRTLDSTVTHVAGLPGTRSTSTDAAENILLVGDDHRPAGASPQVLAELSTGQDGGSTNTDTMMVLHLPAGGAQATVISLPRDSWVDIPGFGMGKLNSAFADGSSNGGGDAGGMQLLIRTVQDMTGLGIDHFVRVSLLGFYQISQVVGPVQVCLNEPVADPYSGIDLPAGVSTLNARQALSFVRQRHGLPRGDLDREVRQQYFLSAELRTVRSSGVLLNPLKLRDLIHAVGSALQTDPGLDLLKLASRSAQLSPSAVGFTTIPTLGTPTIRDSRGKAVSIVAVDSTALPAFIAEVVGEPPAYVDAAAAAPSSVSVRVVNGTGRPGLAAGQAAALRGLGFSAVVDPAGTSTTLTTVTYPAGREAQAKAAAAVVPGAVVAASSAVTQVTLTLGTDGRTVVASPSQSSSPVPPPAPAGRPSSYSGSSCVN
jgi:LCP family protein required for cell wall assembly